MLESSKKYYGYNEEDSRNLKKNKPTKPKNTGKNAARCKTLGICRHWPVYIVVTRDAYGIYDDLQLASIDVLKTLGDFHICEKPSLMQAERYIDKYHDYFYGQVGHPRQINIKNKLIKLT